MNDHANAVVIWEARGLWPVPIEWSNHETQHNESPMSPCSHAQQHDRRSLADGRQTSSAVSSASLRAALPHRCQGCHAASELSLAALRTGYLRAHHTNPVQARKHHISHRVAHPISNSGPDAVSGLVPRTWTYPAFAAGSDGSKTVEAKRCRVLRRTAGSTDCESGLR